MRRTQTLVVCSQLVNEENGRREMQAARRNTYTLCKGFCACRNQAEKQLRQEQAPEAHVHPPWIPYNRVSCQRNTARNLKRGAFRGKSGWAVVSVGANYKLKRKITHRLRHGRMSYATEVFGRRKVTTTSGQTSCFFCVCWVTPWATPLTLGVA